MINSAKKKSKGFTLIEVILVLALAGLIILMILVLVPSVRRSIRNNQRKDDMTVLLRAIDAYTEDNGGVNPLTNIKKCTNDNECQKAVYSYMNTLFEYMGESCKAGDRPSDVVNPGGAPPTFVSFKIKDCEKWIDPKGDSYAIDLRPSGSAGETTVIMNAMEIDTGKIGQYVYENDEQFARYAESDCAGETGENKDRCIEEYAKLHKLEYSDNYKYAMTVFPYSRCGDVEQRVVNTEQPGDVAIFLVLEGGAIGCVDNSGGH